jgi:hypothetical protein
MKFVEIVAILLIVFFVFAAGRLKNHTHGPDK